jgi:hypothetical protein
VAIVLKSGSPSLLELSGLVHFCNGIALPFTERAKQTGEQLLTTKSLTLKHYIFWRKKHANLYGIPIALSFCTIYA